MIGPISAHSLSMMVQKLEANRYKIMRNFNKRLAIYLETPFLEKVANEANKPQSLKAAAKKLKISVYALKRLNEYYKSIK